MKDGRKLLIACGNSLRQDDGAGHLLADGLAAYWRAQDQHVHYIQVHQLVPELALDIAAPDVNEVWFVDCRIAQDATDGDLQLRRVSIINSSAVIGHHLSPAILLLYARRLFDERPMELQPTGWQLTIPGFHFGHAETLSLACQTILDNALRQLNEGGHLPFLFNECFEIVH